MRREDGKEKLDLSLREFAKGQGVEGAQDLLWERLTAACALCAQTVLGVKDAIYHRLARQRLGSQRAGACAGSCGLPTTQLVAS